MKATIEFKFLGVKDYGSTCCPHCGSEGRYIYTWEENGVVKSAMAGCYKLLTGHIQKGDREKYFELLSEKQAKQKKLNGWDVNIVRLLSFDGKYPTEWINEKINEVLRERQLYLSKHRF